MSHYPLQVNHEDLLLQELISRYRAKLPLFQKNIGIDRLADEELRRQNENAIERICKYRLGEVLTNLHKILLELEGETTLNDDTKEDVVMKSTVNVLTLITNCFAFNKKAYVDSHVPHKVPNAEELKEAVCLPPLEDNLCDNLADYVSKIIMKPARLVNADIQKGAAEVYKHISERNFESIFEVIKQQITALTLATFDDNMDYDSSALQLLPHIHYNQDRLSELLLTLSGRAPAFKKNSQIVLAQVLYKAIWCWISECPMQFVTLSKSQRRLSGGADVLFDHIERDWSSKNQKGKLYFWPLQTLLMVLCPDILINVSLATGKSSEVTLKKLYLDNLKKALQAQKAPFYDIAMVCYADMAKLAAFVEKAEMSALRYLAAFVETECMNRLFDPNRPFLDPLTGQLEKDNITDYFISFYRLNPSKMITQVIPTLIDSNANPLYHSILLDALCGIAECKNALPFHPTIDMLYEPLAQHIRDMFQMYLHVDRDTEPFRGATDKKSKVSLEKIQLQNTILTQMVTLFLKDPRIVLWHSEVDQLSTVLTNVRLLLTGLCTMLSEEGEHMESAIKTLLEFHRPRVIELWLPLDVMRGFWDISSHVAIQISDLLIDGDTGKSEFVSKLVELLGELLRSRNRFLHIHSKDQEKAAAQKYSIRFVSLNKLEIALLTNLCSPEPTICSKTALCFDLMCDEAVALDEVEVAHSEDGTAAANPKVVSSETGRPNNPIVVNYDLCRKLANAGVVVTGRALQQRSIRSLLRRFEIQTPGNLYAWIKVHQRWTAFTQLLQEAPNQAASPQQPSGDPSRERMSLAKVATVVRTVTKIQGQNKKMPTVYGRTPASVEPLEHKVMEMVKVEWNNSTGVLCALGGVLLNKVPSQGSEADLTDSDELLDTFMKTMMDLLVSNDLYIREAVVSILGTSLSAAVYPVLFNALNNSLQSYISKKSASTGPLFIDQTISIVRQILDQHHQSSDDLAMADFEVLITPCVQYVSQLLGNSTTLRIKAKLCQLVETLMGRRESISFRHEIAFRNSLLEMMVEWMSDFSGKGREPNKEVKESADPGAPPTVIDLQKLRIDVDQSCMKALVSLLHNMPLQPSEAIITDAEQPEADTGKAKSRLFSKYFNFFTRLMQRCREKPEESPRDLAQYTIQALSNLLNANIDAGLEHIVTMGYHDSHETRAAVVKVITNVLQQGTEFEALSESFAQDRYEKLVDLMLEPDLTLAVALASSVQPAEMDDVAGMLIRVFYVNDSALPLLRAVIDHEVQSTESEGTLFRGNSISTKMLICYARTMGLPYMRSVVQGLMNDFVKADTSVELDPLRLQPGEDMEANLKVLLDSTERFLGAILGSVGTCPSDFRLICNHLYNAVGRRYPTAKRKSVGGFLFLRFFCPAIVAPDMYNLLESPGSDRSRRGLILIAKILQNLANEVQFGGLKEEFMVPCNKFITQNTDRLGKFFDDISTIPTERKEDEDATKEDLSEVEMWHLHRILDAHKDKLANMLCFDNTGEKEAQELKRKSFERLTTLLAQLGTPPEASKTAQAVEERLNQGAARSTDATNLHFEEFMTRMATRDVKVIKDRELFYESGVSRMGKPVFYYIARRYDSVKLDLDLVIYFLLKTAQPAFSRSFELVIDLTLFSDEHEVQKAWCLKFLKLLPHDADAHCSAIYLLNPNSWFKKYAKQCVAKLISSKASKRITFLTSIVELKDVIPECEKALPQSTLAVMSDCKTTFTPVLRVSQYGQKEVLVKTGSNVMHVVNLKPQNLLGVHGCLLDVYHFSRIEDVKMRDESTGEFVITYEWHGEKTLCLRTPQANQLIQTIKQAKARYLLTKPAADKVAKRIFRPSDVPGTLINMALLNMASSYGELRNAAYNLAQACSETFNFDIRHILLPADGVGIPKNCRRLILALSDMLAHSAPHLTLELLGEAMHGFKHSSTQLKHITLHYITPWLRNLEAYVPEGMEVWGWEKGPTYNYAAGLPESASSAAAQPGTEDSGNAMWVNANGEVDKGVIEKYEKVESLLYDMFSLTLTEARMYHAFLTHVWQPISCRSKLLAVVLRVMMRKALNCGFMSGYTETAAEVCVTLASKDAPPVIPNLLISRLRYLMEEASLTYMTQEERDKSTAAPVQVQVDDDDPQQAILKLTEESQVQPPLLGDVKPGSEPVNHPSLSGSLTNAQADPKVKLTTSETPRVFTLDESAQWPEICVILRMLLALSFDDLLDVKKHMPELLHIILNTFHVGNPLVRTTVYGLLMNLLQCVCLIDKDKKDKPVRLRFLLTELSQPKWLLLFGVTSTQPFAQLTSSELQRMLNKRLEPASVTNTLPVAMMLADVIRLSSDSLPPETTSQWHHRWLSLSLKVAFKRSRRALQTRALMAMGSLVDREELVNDDLVGQLLVLLAEALPEAVQQASTDAELLELPIAIIMCLAQIVTHIPTTSFYLSSMFWVAMSVIEVSDISLFQAGLLLLENVIKTYDERGLARDDVSLQTYCMWARRHLVEAAATRLDQLTQIHFSTSFSFAVSCNLLKGLRHPQTKSATINVLSRFLHIGTKGLESELGPESLGYAAALLPTEARHGSVLLQNMADRSREHLYTRQLLPDTKTAALLLSMFTTVLTKAEYETEQLFMYSLLRVAIVTIPDIFPVVHDYLMPKITQILSNSHNPEIVAAVQSILYTMVSAKEKLRPTMQNALTPAYLSEIGYGGLPLAGSFADVSPQRRSNIAQCAAVMLSSLVERVLQAQAAVAKASSKSPAPTPGTVASPVPNTPIRDVPTPQPIVSAQYSSESAVITKEPPSASPTPALP